MTRTFYRFASPTKARLFGLALPDAFFGTRTEVDEALRVALEAYAVEYGEDFAEEDIERVAAVVADQRDLYVTTAPESYDGFGTFAVGTEPADRDRTRKATLRVVAIAPEHVSWQTMRYASGNEAAVPYGSDEHAYLRGD